MIDIEKLTGISSVELGNITAESDGNAANEETSSVVSGGLFLVEVKSLPGDEFEVYIDSDARGADGKPKGVSIEDCIRLTRAIEAHFDREQEDFSLTVSSAGIGQPLRILRQYLKLVGRKVDVVMRSGKKSTSVLQAADTDSITLDDERIALTEIKTTKEHIDFK